MSHAIDYRLGETPPAEDLWRLYREAGIRDADSQEALHRSVSQSTWVAAAWDEGRLVGLARVLTDGVWVAYVQELLVHPDFHHQGVGKELFDRFEEAFGHFRHQVIVTETDWVRAKCLKRGFHEEPAALSRWRPLA